MGAQNTGGWYDPALVMRMAVSRLRREMRARRRWRESLFSSRGEYKIALSHAHERAPRSSQASGNQEIKRLVAERASVLTDLCARGAQFAQSRRIEQAGEDC